MKIGEKAFILKYVKENGRKGLFAGMDSHSGGYPYETDNLNQIYYWKNKQEAEEYMNSFNKSVVYGRFTMHEVSLVLLEHVDIKAETRKIDLEIEYDGLE